MLINIQMLRFIAAFMVLLYHGATYYGMMGGDSFLLLFRYIGFSGVDVFFVISGFIICYTNRNTSGLQNNCRFLYQRFCRVYLGYWPFLFIALVVMILGRPGALEKINLWKSFFLIWDVPPTRVLRLSWTLSFELYFYFSFFVLLFTPHRYRILLALSVLLLAFNLYIAIFQDAFSPSGFRNFSKQLRFFTHPFMFEFFMGCFVAYAIEQGWRKYANAALVFGIALFVVAFVLNTTALDGTIGKYYNYHLRIGIFGIGSACIVYGLIHCENRGRIFLPGWGLLLGGASYSLYLSHIILLRVFRSMGLFDFVEEHELNPELFYLLTLLVIVAFSAAFYSWVERPVYQYAKKIPGRFLESRKARSVT